MTVKIRFTLPLTWKNRSALFRAALSPGKDIVMEDTALNISNITINGKPFLEVEEQVQQDKIT